MTAAGPQTLVELLEQDRSEDRSVLAGSPEYDALRGRDAARREAVRARLRAYPALSTEELYAAAWVLNHGEAADDAETAHGLAVASAQRGLVKARWLAAASLDRSLMYSGRPQRYGTNIVPDGVRYRLWDVESGTTDAERAEWGVPPLAEMQRRADELSARAAQPPLDHAPRWLAEAIGRWNAEDAAGAPGHCADEIR